MILSAELLDIWDRCERRFAFEQEWQSRIISPTELLYKAVEHAITASGDPEQAAKDEILKLATEYEIEHEYYNPQFFLIRHLGYLAGIISVELVQRFGQFTLREQVDCGEFIWQSGLFTTSAANHRIELVSYLDDDRLRASAHSWRVIGELAALQTPLTLTQVVIGPQRGGKRHSVWAKGSCHPQNHQLRFQKRSGGALEGWEECWRDRSNIATELWLKTMAKDGVLEPLIQSRLIAYNPIDHRMIAAREEMTRIAKLMPFASERSLMRRSSCDEIGRGACPFQRVCYSPVETHPSQLPELYWPRPLPSPSPR